jgi:hypothetical protein
MLKIYLDDSGTHAAAPWVVVGGLIGTEDQWKNFDADWRAKLLCPMDGKKSLNKFSLYDCQEAINEFEGYSRNESDLVTGEFRRIIKRSGVVGYSSAIDKIAWVVSQRVV